MLNSSFFCSVFVQFSSGVQRGLRGGSEGVRRGLRGGRPFEPSMNTL